MHCRKILPYVLSYSAAVSACEKGQLLQEMPCREIMPDTISYSADISACEKGSVEMPYIGPFALPTQHFCNADEPEPEACNFRVRIASECSDEKPTIESRSDELEIALAELIWKRDAPEPRTSSGCVPGPTLLEDYVLLDLPTAPSDTRHLGGSTAYPATSPSSTTSICSA